MTLFWGYPLFIKLDKLIWAMKKKYLFNEFVHMMSAEIYLYVSIAKVLSHAWLVWDVRKIRKMLTKLVTAHGRWGFQKSVPIPESFSLPTGQDVALTCFSCAVPVITILPTATIMDSASGIVSKPPIKCFFPLFFCFYKSCLGRGASSQW